MSALTEWDDYVNTDACPSLAMVKGDAAIESLKCCGSCEHINPKGPWCREAGNLWNHEAAVAIWTHLLTDGSIDDRVLLKHHCHFTPSRWTSRGELA